MAIGNLRYHESFNKRISMGALETDQNNATRVFYINASVTNVPTSLLCASRDAGDIIINVLLPKRNCYLIKLVCNL